MKGDGDGGIPGAGTKADRFRQHMEKWKSIYEVAGVVLALLVSCLALVLSSRANSLTRTALEIQQTEFRLRTRPYIVLGVHSTEVTGPATTADGRVQNHILTVKLRNPTDIPAFDVHFAATVVVDNKAGATNVVPPRSVSPFGKVAIFRDDEPRYPVAIPDEIYNLLDTSGQSVSVDMVVTYYGVLQKSLLYETDIRLVYDHSGKNFYVANLDPK